MKIVALVAALGICLTGDALAACALSPAVFAKVTIRSCEGVTFRASSAQVHSDGRSYFPHPPNAEYTGTLLSVRVESSELRWPMPPPHLFKSGESWPVGSWKSLVMDGSPQTICGDRLPKTIEVATTLVCCDTIPSSGGHCLVPRELILARQPPTDEKWYLEAK